MPPLAGAAVAAVAACSAASGQGPTAAAPSVSQSLPAIAYAAAADSTTTLVVPAGEGGGALSAPHTLTVSAGWTATVWARVPDARMEAWTPEGDLLVSQPARGSVVELRPDTAGTATVTTLLSGLSNPQGLAFATVGGATVLYVAESNQIDRYPWGPRGIGGARTVLAAALPDPDPAGDDVHRMKDVTVAADGTVYFNVGSSSNANPDDRTMMPQRAVIMAVRPDGTDLRVVERGIRNGEGLAVAPDGTVWTAVNERDNIPYPAHGPHTSFSDAFGQVIRAYVNEHPPDEVVPVTAGRDLGWPYCDPDQDGNHPAGSLANVPLVPNAVTNPGGGALDCAALKPVEVGVPAHSAPLGMTFLAGSKLPAPWTSGAAVAAHGSWDRQPPRSPAVLWLDWDSAKRTLLPGVTLTGGFQNADGSFWGRPVDAVPGPDGALYVSDDAAGAIYRLAPPH
ncbi:gluconolaconase [Trebonia kvetii]|uniref:Gluconolaconase n=1 Tax=Trebonia kvetii TaxID=2480626 RepID=A0A6P2C655_9ACTN|nr:gluconolaconase [Trebonia kvetii]